MTCDVITCQTLFSIISRTHDATCLLRQLADGFQMSHRLDGPTQLPILAERADQPHTFLLQNKHINKSTCARKDVGSNAQDSRATGADVRAAITATKHPAEYKNGSASVWSLMSTSTNHSITLKILKRFPPVVSFNCMGVFSFFVFLHADTSVSTSDSATYDFSQSQPVGFGFPLTSCAPVAT